MNSEHIRARFQLSPVAAPNQLRDTRKKRASAVMLPIIDIDNHAHILLCKRPTYLHHHPGEICLPGGKFEPSDIKLRTTALRELEEELNIAPSNVTVLGQLPEHSTLTGFSISPFVGLLNKATTWENDHNEVQASFLLSLSDLSNDANWQPLPFQRFGKKITLQGFPTPQGLLWGATASIIKNFTKQLALPV
ncbi:CoA pyrophosphatase [Pseudoalteromonas carrageenovora]|uniref:NUDIX hydrolase n=1 Tax=Pseudoalteromonas carrageenovora TaxID=227 RepID=UPI00311DE1F6